MMNLDRWDDDPRGFKKKQDPFKKILSYGNKLSWVGVVLLFIFVLQLRSHKQALKNEVELHKEENAGLVQTVDHLDKHVTEKTRALQEVHRLHGETKSYAQQREAQVKELETRAAQAESAYQECIRSAKIERERYESQKCEDCSRTKSDLANEQHLTAKLRAEIDRLRAELDRVREPQTIQRTPSTRTVDRKTASIPRTVATPAPRTQQEEPSHPHRRAAQDDHVDAAILENENEIEDHGTQDQSQEKVDEAPRGGRFRRNRFSRDDHETAGGEEQQQQQQQVEHEEEYRTPDKRKSVKKRGRRKGGLSMLEEHLGMEQVDDENVDTY